jgi:diaminohydroxyphosphoribosylaminopyrimidine deaminase/5-amino-6-(5-phosphoribosylamino)uracil reductase
VEIDEAMQRAVVLGASARLRTAPNPWVGCVLLQQGEVIAEGATEPPGGRHAEIVALDAAGAAARGATAVVTLEPCAHQGRTGPCVDALIAAGVSEVVFGVEDPDPDVAGAGRAALEAAGLTVLTGVRAAEVADSLRSYLHQRSTGRPWVVWKTAMSLDGRIAARDGSSQWITGEAARHDAHRIRAESQAILIGSGTALADRPSLTVRGVDGFDGPPPLRVLLDRSGSTPAEGPLFDLSLAPTLVCTGLDTDAAAWKAAGAEVIALSSDATGIDLTAVLDELGRRGVVQLLVEGGARVAGSFLAADAVNEIVAFIAPVTLGADALPAAVWPGPDTVADAPHWRLVDASTVVPDIRLTYLRSS